MSTQPVESATEPSVRSCTAAAVPISPETCDITAKPTPRRRPARGGSAGAARCASRTRVRHSRSTQEGTGWPPKAVSPGRMAFFRRSSTGSMPSFAASSSICDSPAKLACGLPKPRNEPGAQLVGVDRLAMRAHVGDAVGPARHEQREGEHRRALVGVGAAVEW